MSIALNGAAGSYFFRNSGTVTSTGAETFTFWTKRTANFAGLKILLTVRPNPETSGHDLVINDPNDSVPYRPIMQANWAATQAKPPDALALDTWTFVAIVGSGANISVKVWDGTVLDNATVAQTVFTGARERWGDAGAGTTVYTGLFAHIRVWNAALTDNEINAERVSDTVVKTASLLSAHSMGGGSITAALTGQTGTAYTNGGGATYSADMPTFSTFSGTVISGDAQMPSESVVATGTRYNRFLWSGDLSNAVWNKQGNTLITGAASAPSGFGNSQRVRIAVDTGGVYQSLGSVPSGPHLAVMAVRRVDVDHVAMRHMASTFASGAQGHFNLLTGQWGFTTNFGGHVAGTFGSRVLSNGWYLIWVGANLGGQVNVEFFPILTNGTQIPATGRSVDVAGFQYEAGSLATYHKPTAGTITSRSLASGAVTLSVATIPVAGTSTATASFLDTAGAPWDQDGTISWTTSNAGVASIGTISSASTDLNGRVTAVVTGVAIGTANIGANDDGGITATPAMITVSGSGTSTRQVEILTEPGWEGTNGWFVAVYERHVSARFPTNKLFEVSGQAFQGAQLNGQSRMLVSVPGAVSVSQGQVVEVVLENDNIGGSAVDGPGIFPATVI